MNLVQSAKNLLARFDVKPADGSRITLFANKAEAVVFWLSLTGLAVVCVLALFRYLTARQINIDHDSLRTSQQELRLEIESLRQQNAALEQQVRELGLKFQRSQVSNDSLLRQIRFLPRPSQPDRGAPASPPLPSDGRSARLKLLFQIEEDTPAQSAAR